MLSSAGLRQQYCWPRNLQREWAAKRISGRAVSFFLLLCLFFSSSADLERGACSVDCRRVGSRARANDDDSRFGARPFGTLTAGHSAMARQKKNHMSVSLLVVVLHNPRNDPAGRTWPWRGRGVQVGWPGGRGVRTCTAGTRAALLLRPRVRLRRPSKPGGRSDRHPKACRCLVSSPSPQGAVAMATAHPGLPRTGGHVGLRARGLVVGLARSLFARTRFPHWSIFQALPVTKNCFSSASVAVCGLGGAGGRAAPVAAQRAAGGWQVLCLSSISPGHHAAGARGGAGARAGRRRRGGRAVLAGRAAAAAAAGTSARAAAGQSCAA